MKILGSEITPYKTYLNRRKFIEGSFASALLATVSSSVLANHNTDPSTYNQFMNENDKVNSYEEITTYNNFYEFGTHKKHPHLNSGDFKPKPWSVKIDGLVKKPMTIDLEKILSKVTIEDRVYRLRCVEAWSMVIPWQGFQLSELIKMAEPLSSAKYIQFVTVFRPEEMPGQKKRTINWPYREGPVSYTHLRAHET